MKIPLSFTLKNRDSTTSKDARVLNGYVEVLGNPKKGVVIRTYKRPALTQEFESVSTGTGQGLYIPSDPTSTGVPGVIVGDTLFRAPTTKPTRLAFTTQPVNWKLDTAISPSVVVTARDSFGNTMTGYTGTVTIALYTNPAGGTLSGTVSVAAVAGVATFNNLKLDMVGGGYSFIATASSMIHAVSSTFKIISNLSFTVQPASNPPNTTFDTPVEVSVVDASSNVITGYTGNITVSIGTNPSGGTLSGTLTVSATNGVASFTNLEIDLEGNGYTLVASASTGNLVNVTSNSFDITTAFSLTVGTFLSLTGYRLPATSFGSISPTTYLGNTIRSLNSDDSELPNSIFELIGNLSQSYFTSITRGGVSLTSASATYQYLPGINTTQWRWDGAPASLLLSGQVGTVTIVIA